MLLAGRALRAGAAHGHQWGLGRVLAASAEVQLGQEARHSCHSCHPCGLHHLIHI